MISNHIYGIIIINKSDFAENDGNVQTQDVASLAENHKKIRTTIAKLGFHIRGFKIGATKSARLINPDLHGDRDFMATLSVISGV